MALSPYEQFRRDLRDLNILAKRDVDSLWRMVRDSRDAKEALLEVLPEVVETYGQAAGAVAAEFYDAVREQAGARGRFAPIVSDVGDTNTRSLVAWALGEARDGDAFRSLIEGGLESRVTNAARAVVTASSIADPFARGWMRTGGGGCDFCAMLVTRGAVYTEESVDFAAHDRCRCGVAPAFNPEQVRAVREEFVPSARRRSDETKATDRARVNAWIDANL